MALDKIKGRDVTLSVQRTVGGVPTWIVVGCATDVSLKIDRESDESTCTASGDAKEFEPGQYSWTSSATLNVRQATDVAAGTGGVPPAQTDASDNVTAENFVTLALSGEIFKIRYTLGAGTGRVRYVGSCFITGAEPKGQQKGLATFAASLQGTGPLVPEITQ